MAPRNSARLHFSSALKAFLNVFLIVNSDVHLSVGKLCSEFTKNENDLLFGRYVGVLGWGVPDEEEPGKHPDKTATTWKGILGKKENSNAKD